MNTPGSILDYATLERKAPRKLTLEEFDRSVRVIFAVAPQWLYQLAILMDFLVGLVKLVIGVSIFRMVWQLTYALRQPTREQIVALRHFGAEIFIPTGIGVLFWWALGAYHCRMYYRWGQIPRVLTANEHGLILSRLGWWHMQERRWPASEIATIELRPVRGNLNCKRTVSHLFIRLRNGRRLRFRLSTSVSLLPGRIAERLALALGCPLKEPP